MRPAAGHSPHGGKITKKTVKAGKGVTFDTDGGT